MLSPLFALQGVVICLFLAAAILVLARPRFARSAPRVASTPLAGRLALAILPLLSSGAVALSTLVPVLAFFAAGFAALVALILGAYALRRHLRVVCFQMILAFVAAFAIAVLQPLGLKVLLLPKADALPYEPVAAHVVHTYPEGVWLESVRTGHDGTLYLAANIGLDFTRRDYYHNAHGEVIAHAADGSERILFDTPTGSTAGVFAVAADGTLYMSSNGVNPGIWRIDRDGRAALFARLPAGAWPNGLAFGPDGNLYSPDSALGRVWRIDPHTGGVQTAVADAALSARPFIALAPGGNGLRFRGREMIVTVSDRTTVLSFKMEGDGRFAAPVVLATGIPGDDFAVGSDGALFITTHPYNTLVRLTPDGRRAIIGDVRQGIVGATDASFGATGADRDILYVATDGGAFTGGAKARGQLLALRPYSNL